MIKVDGKTGDLSMDGSAKELFAELIYLEKTLQNEWRKKGNEETFKRIIIESLEAEELEKIMKEG